MKNECFQQKKKQRLNKEKRVRNLKCQKEIHSSLGGEIDDKKIISSHSNDEMNKVEITAINEEDEEEYYRLGNSFKSLKKYSNTPHGKKLRTDERNEKMPKELENCNRNSDDENEKNSSSSDSSRTNSCNSSTSNSSSSDDCRSRENSMSRDKTSTSESSDTEEEEEEMKKNHRDIGETLLLDNDDTPMNHGQQERGQAIYNQLYNFLDEKYFIGDQLIYFTKIRNPSIQLSGGVNTLYIHSTKSFSKLYLDDSNLFSPGSDINIFLSYQVTFHSNSDVVQCHAILRDGIENVEIISIDDILKSLFPNDHLFVIVVLVDSSVIETFGHFVNGILSTSTNRKFILKNLKMKEKQMLYEYIPSSLPISTLFDGKKQKITTGPKKLFKSFLLQEFGDDTPLKIVTRRGYRDASKMFPNIYKDIQTSYRRFCKESNLKKIRSQISLSLEELDSLQKYVIKEEGSIGFSKKPLTGISINGRSVSFFVNDQLHVTLNILANEVVDRVIKSYFKHYLIEKRMKMKKSTIGIINIDVKDEENAINLAISPKNLENFGVFFIHRILCIFENGIKNVNLNSLAIEYCH